jgi:hypothetical protein
VRAAAEALRWRLAAPLDAPAEPGVAVLPDVRLKDADGSAVWTRGVLRC